MTNEQPIWSQFIGQFGKNIISLDYASVIRDKISTFNSIISVINSIYRSSPSKYRSSIRYIGRRQHYIGRYSNLSVVINDRSLILLKCENL
ncbi:hypothetical protein [Peribacillus tepidiphilus]|uniref:hypothetical protein n=1 Tax=Peribacillus tepidiphilus TaxID=2652445 RepID=UPI0035B53E26